MGTKTTLRCTTDGHNKAYEVMLYEYSPNSWKVDFAYGKIGSALLYSTKTTTPVGQYAASRIANKLISEKLGKGYVIQSTIDWPVAVPVAAPKSIVHSPGFQVVVPKAVQQKVALDNSLKAHKAIPKVVKVIKPPKSLRRVSGPVDLSFLDDDEEDE